MGWAEPARAVSAPAAADGGLTGSFSAAGARRRYERKKSVGNPGHVITPRVSKKHGGSGQEQIVNNMFLVTVELPQPAAAAVEG